MFLYLVRPSKEFAMQYAQGETVRMNILRNLDFYIS